MFENPRQTRTPDPSERLTPKPKPIMRHEISDGILHEIETISLMNADT